MRLATYVTWAVLLTLVTGYPPRYARHRHHCGGRRSGGKDSHQMYLDAKKPLGHFYPSMGDVVSSATSTVVATFNEATNSNVPEPGDGRVHTKVPKWEI